MSLTRLSDAQLASLERRGGGETEEGKEGGDEGEKHVEYGIRDRKAEEGTGSKQRSAGQLRTMRVAGKSPHMYRFSVSGSLPIHGPATRPKMPQTGKP